MSLYVPPPLHAPVLMTSVSLAATGETTERTRRRAKKMPRRECERAAVIFMVTEGVIRSGTHAEG